MSSSAWLLSGGHHHGHSHGHGHAHDHEHGGETRHIALGRSNLEIEIFEDNVPPCFRVRADAGVLPAAADVSIETIRPDGSRQLFSFEQRGGYLESRERDSGAACLQRPTSACCRKAATTSANWNSKSTITPHAHGAHHRDNNMRAAVIHVIGDAAVSVLVIVGLVLARTFGWLWMDPLAGLIGALVIANWSFGLLRDTGSILLDRTPDPRMAE